MSRSAKAFALRLGGRRDGARRLQPSVALALLLLASACIHRPTPNPNVLVVGVTSGPNNLDPRIGTDDVSAKASQLVFNNLMTLDEHLRVVPDLAERLENPDPTTYLATLRRGVKFHDGHELTSADVVYTFRSFTPARCRRPASTAAPSRMRVSIACSTRRR